MFWPVSWLIWAADRSMPGIKLHRRFRLRESGNATVNREKWSKLKWGEVKVKSTRADFVGLQDLTPFSLAIDRFFGQSYRSGRHAVARIEGMFRIFANEYFVPFAAIWFSPERSVSQNLVQRTRMLRSGHWRPQPIGHELPVAVTLQFLHAGAQ
jgi:hypothetical protein